MRWMDGWMDNVDGQTIWGMEDLMDGVGLTLRSRPS